MKKPNLLPALGLTLLLLPFFKNPAPVWLVPAIGKMWKAISREVLIK